MDGSEFPFWAVLSLIERLLSSLVCDNIILNKRFLFKAFTYCKGFTLMFEPFTMCEFYFI